MGIGPYDKIYLIDKLKFETAGKIKVQNVGKSIDKPPVLKYMYTVSICKLGNNTLEEINYRNGGG